MTLNKQLTEIFNSYTESVRTTPEYIRYYELIKTELTARVSKGNLTPFQVGNVPDTVRDTLYRDLTAQGLCVHEVNGHRLDVSIRLPVIVQ